MKDEIILMSSDHQDESDGGVATINKQKIELPKKYKVLLHNDDYTTMEFVVYVLQVIFKKSSEEAYQIMMKIHQQGQGICGVFTYEVAESKMHKVTKVSRENGHPLKCTIEAE